MASTHAPARWLVAVETLGSVHSNESQRCALTQLAPCVVVEHKEKDKDRGLAEVRREGWQELGQHRQTSASWDSVRREEGAKRVARARGESGLHC